MRAWLYLSTFIAVAFAVAWAATEYRLEKERGRVVAALNLAAEKDTGMRRLVREKDSVVAVFQRLAVQSKVKIRESLREKGRKGTAVATVQVMPETVVTQESRDIERRGDSVVVSEGELDALDSLGVAVSARVNVRLAAGTSDWWWRVERAPLSFEVSLMCRGPMAESAVVGPAWAKASLRVVQDESVCRERRWQAFGVRMPSAPVAVGIAAASVVAWELLRRATGGGR
jgi:hypothetical protein